MAHWYHGTSPELASLIEVDGPTSRYYGRDFQRFGEPLHTLRKLREHVADWYGAVVDLDVPDDEASGKGSLDQRQAPTVCRHVCLVRVRRLTIPTARMKTSSRNATR